MDQVIQMLGAVLVLYAFIASQLGRMRTDSPTFLALNAVGTGILCAVAAAGRDVGFTLVEGVWAVVSLRGFVRAVTAKADPELI